MSDTVLFVDNTYGSLASGVGATDTTITLTAGHGVRFPAVGAGQVLYATILNAGNVLEQIHITTHTASSDTLIATRGQNATVAKAWTAGDRIECRLTSEHMTAFSAFRNVAASWIGGQRGVPVALTSTASSIAINLDDANNFTHTMTENTTLAAPTGTAVAGQSGTIVITQHASSPKILSYNTFWKFPGGIVPTLTATNSAVDVISYYVESASRATCTLLADVK